MAAAKQQLALAAAPITLEDLAPETVAVRVVHPSGKVLVFPMRVLTWHEWNAIGAQVLDPLQGNREYWTRRNAAGEKEFDPENVAYRQALDAAQSKRSYLRVLLALELAGNDVRRGDTEDEQVQNLIKAVSIANAVQLVSTLERLSLRGMASIHALAESFPDERVHEAGSDAVSPEGVDAEPVGEPAG